MRDEILNGVTFRAVIKVRVVVNDWLEHYNETRPHRSLKMITMAGFAADTLAQTPPTE